MWLVGYALAPFLLAVLAGLITHHQWTRRWALFASATCGAIYFGESQVMGALNNDGPYYPSGLARVLTVILGVLACLLITAGVLWCRKRIAGRGSE